MVSGQIVQAEEVILARICVAKDMAGLAEQVKLYISPLYLPSEEKSKTELHALAKQFVPFLVKVLKNCAASLSEFPGHDHAAAQKKGNELFLVMRLAVEGLDCLRSWLVGCPFEIELQRYGLVRRLMTWKRYDAALHECQRLLYNICAYISFCGEEGDRKYKVKNVKIMHWKQLVDLNIAEWSDGRTGNEAKAVVLPLPPEGALPSLIDLVVGVVVDLIVCNTETGASDCSFSKALQNLLQQLEPWLRKMEFRSEEKQRELLFRALYSYSLRMIDKTTIQNLEHLRLCCTLTLNYCASSTQRNQYLKVARKLGSCLSSSNSLLEDIALDLLASSLNQAIDGKQQTGFTDHEVLDTVESLARLCQTRKTYRHGWHHIFKIVQRAEQMCSASLIVVAGYYAVGLILLEKGTDMHDPNIQAIKLVNNNLSAADDSVLCQLLHNAITVASQIFVQESRFQKESGNQTTVKFSKEVFSTGKVRVSIYRALDFFRRNSTEHLQNKWSKFICKLKRDHNAVDEEETEKYNSSFIISLCLLVKVLMEGDRCDKADFSELQVFQNARQTIPTVAIMALKVLLIRREGYEDFMVTMRRFFSSTVTKADELRWFISSLYNIGVQIFNCGDYCLACVPLELAFDAAWARTNLLKSVLNQQKLSAEQNDSVLACSFAVSEACSKTGSLVDSLNRAGKNELALDKLRYGFVNWAQMHVVVTVECPEALIKLWVKMAPSYKDIAKNGFQSGPVCLYGFLYNLKPALPMKTLGSLLEKELSIIGDMEHQNPSLYLHMKDRIVNILLDNIYNGVSFPLERSNILLEKCRYARTSGVESIQSCVRVLTEAISVLTEALQDLRNDPKDLLQIQLEVRSATVHCVRAFCSHEADPQSDAYLEDILAALELWRRFVDALKAPAQNGCISREEITSRSTSFFNSLPPKNCIGVLLTASDLLALKGYSKLQIQVQELVLKITAVDEMHSEEELCAQLLADNCVGHAFCYVPYTEQFISLLKKHLGENGISLSFWHMCAQLHPSSLLSIQQTFISHELLDYGDTTTFLKETDMLPNALESLKAMACSLVANIPKTAQAALTHAVMLSRLSEYVSERGDVMQAIEYAKQSLLLRFKVLQNKFQRIITGSLDTTSKSRSHVFETSLNKSETKFEVFGAVATVFWPRLNFENGREHIHPSQWRVFGDYLQSLMQVGVLYEKVGLVADAERSFQEGLRLCLLQNMLFAEALFRSCLGELHRKKHLWDEAKLDFEKASEAFTHSSTNFTCSLCMTVGTALLELRAGDLARCCNGYRSQLNEKKIDRQSSLTNCAIMSALSHYDKAENGLAKLLSDSPTGICHNAVSNFEDGLEEYKKEVMMESLPVDVELCEEGKLEERLERPSRRGRSSRSSKVDNRHSSKPVLPIKAEKTLCDEMLKVSIRVKSASAVSEAKLISDGSLRKKKTRTKGAASTKPKNGSVSGSNDVSRDSIDISNSTTVSDEESIRSCVIIQSNKNQTFSTMLDWSRYKWEISAKRLMARILIQKGKSYHIIHKYDAVDSAFVAAMSLLSISGCRSAKRCECVQNELVCLDVHRGNGNYYAFEEALILYHLSWLALWKRHVNARSDYCCLADGLGMRPWAWLHRAFSLCTEIPPLLQKVSSLLAILHIPRLSCSTHMHSRCSISDLQGLAACFHQLSIGTGVRQEQLMRIKKKLTATSDFSSSRMETYLNDVRESLRLKNSSEFLQSGPWKEISSTICCISVVGKELAFLLLDKDSSSFKDAMKNTACLLVSRWSGEAAQIFHLPILPIAEGHNYSVPFLDEEKSSPYDLSDNDDDDSVVNGRESFVELDNKNILRFGPFLETLVVEFYSIMQESCLSTSSQIPINTQEEKAFWWKWRMELDGRLRSLLRKLEDSWLGPWKCLLLGEPSKICVVRAFEAMSQKLVRKLNSTAFNKKNNELFADNHIVKVLLQAVPFLEDNELEDGIARILGWNCTSNPEICILESANKPRIQVCFNQQQGMISQVAVEFKEAYEEAIKEALQVKESYDGKRKSRKQTRQTSRKERTSLFESLDAIVHADTFGRQPVVLVLDSKLQAFPWESIPILRKQEVYRMPSLGSISALVVHLNHITLSKADKQDLELECRKLCIDSIDFHAPSRPVKEDSQVIRKPCINPYNAYYVLNPGGDLGSTQAAFESWFKEQKGWEGRAGEAPSSVEYMKALEEHDLFVYFGHGSGEQYLPERILRKLDQCAAALLMGCSSGKLSLQGDYEPTGVPFSYLMAGCPVAIANLWDVTDGDIDRFSRTILRKWLGFEESTTNPKEDMRIAPSGSIKFRTVSSRTRSIRWNKDPKDVEDELPTCCPCTLDSSKNLSSFGSEENNVGSTLESGRSCCRLPYLVGASPVCYGIPTALLRL